MSDAWLSKLRDPNPWSAPRPLPKAVEVGGFCIRLYEKGDGPALFSAIDEHRESLLPWMVWTTTDHRSVDDSIHYVEKVRRAYEKPDSVDFSMGIFDTKTKQLIGGTGFHHADPNLRCAEIGYWIRGDYQGKGVCTRVIGALISAGLRSIEDGGWGLRRLVIFNNVENVGSRRVCEKLGLRLEMRMKKERYLEPEYRDMLGFAVLADEWDFEKNCAKPNIGWT
jgi:ribosomal-protein-serine acetyltransferase